MEVAKIRLFWPEEGGKLYWSDIPTLLTLPILSWMSLYRAKATPRAWIIISLATAVSSFLLVSPKMNFGEMGSVGSLINLSTLVPISYILALVARFSSIGESLNHSLTASNRSLE